MHSEGTLLAAKVTQVGFVEHSALVGEGEPPSFLLFYTEPAEIEVDIVSR